MSYTTCKTSELGVLSVLSSCILLRAFCPGRLRGNDRFFARALQRCIALGTGSWDERSFKKGKSYTSSEINRQKYRNSAVMILPKIGLSTYTITNDMLTKFWRKSWAGFFARALQRCNFLLESGSAVNTLSRTPCSAIAHCI